MLQIYNTLTKRKEEFIPKNPPNVTIYVCGPTVYDYFHIGNARSFIMGDIVRRYLEYKGFNVKYVMNITDVDDKIIRKSIEQEVPSGKVAEEFANAFLEDALKLKMKPADVFPRATEHIEDIVELISKIEEKGSAYNVDGNVFYDVSKFNGYGKLSGKKIEDLESGSRVEINVEKKNPLDFSLWKKAKEGEPFWESPWGKGRPGWHIECSAMSTKHLGETIDIHAGGNDLIFPHHENEIAQSEAATGHQFVKYWIHFGFLNIQNEKMSKSLGNFFTAREILKKYSAQTIRLLFSQTHYGGPLNFSEELIQSAQKGLEKINNLAERIEREMNSNSNDDAEIDFDYKKYYSEFESAMDDNFNSPQAAAAIFDFVRDFNRFIADNENLPLNNFKSAKEYLQKTAQDVLGILDFSELTISSNSFDEGLIDLLIELRNNSKEKKDYSTADNIRNELANLNIVLEDGKAGTTYKLPSSHIDDIEESVLKLIGSIRMEAKSKKDFTSADLIRDKLSELGYIIQDSKDGFLIKRN